MYIHVSLSLFLSLSLSPSVSVFTSLDTLDNVEMTEALIVA